MLGLFMTSDVDQRPFLPSFNKVIKELKREENSLYNCINSILADTSFVQQIAALHPGIPLYANLRCGRWYLPKPDGTCYFKSTDGHFGEWNFSITRLNWHIALAAAESGGCIIVDATRRGKSFPDALTKTIPIWAAVINKAIRMHLSQSTGQQHPTATGKTSSLANLCEAQVDATHCLAEAAVVASSSEVAACDAVRGDWDEGIHLPIWISSTEKAQIEQHLQEWADNLLKAGIGLNRLAQVLTKPFRPLWVSQKSRIWLNEMPRPDDLQFTPLILVSASVPDSRQRQSHCIASTADGQPREVAFDYVPGAGDDEESWAKGLTPEVFWRNKELLLNAGPDGVSDAVQKLLGGNSAKFLSSNLNLSQPTVFPGVDSTGSGDVALHCLAPIGCRSTQPRSFSMVDKPCFVRETGLALGSRQAALSPEVWEHVGAVLNVGSQKDARTETNKDAYLHLHMKSSKEDRHALQNCLAEALQFLHKHLVVHSQVLVYCDTGTDQSVCVALAALLCLFTLPDAGAKFYLKQSLPATVLTACNAASHRRRRDAQKLASSSLEDSEQEEEAGPCDDADLTQGSRHASEETENQSRSLLKPANSCQDNEYILASQLKGGISKDLMRQRLAYISTHYPAARPSRGNLKEVYNFARLHTSDL